jgi:hypothetical protein
MGIMINAWETLFSICAPGIFLGRAQQSLAGGDKTTTQGSAHHRSLNLEFGSGLRIWFGHTLFGHYFYRIIDAVTFQTRPPSCSDFEPVHKPSGTGSFCGVFGAKCACPLLGMGAKRASHFLGQQLLDRPFT